MRLKSDLITSDVRHSNVIAGVVKCAVLAIGETTPWTPEKASRDSHLKTTTQTTATKTGRYPCSPFGVLQLLSVPSWDSTIDREASWSRRPGSSLLLACTYAAGSNAPTSAGYATKSVESRRCHFGSSPICHQPLNPDAAAEQPEPAAIEVRKVTLVFQTDSGRTRTTAQ